MPPRRGRRSPTLCWPSWTARKSPGGEALAGLLRKGNAGSHTVADHISVLDQALASLPAGVLHPDPETDGGPTVVVRSDTLGAFARHFELPLVCALL